MCSVKCVRCVKCVSLCVGEVIRVSYSAQEELEFVSCVCE